MVCFQVQGAAASGVASFAVLTDGTVWSWGTSKRGQLGLGAGVLVLILTLILMLILMLISIPLLYGATSPAQTGFSKLSRPLSTSWIVRCLSLCTIADTVSFKWQQCVPGNKHIKERHLHVGVTPATVPVILPLHLK